jgi:hypothetical protein
MDGHKFDAKTWKVDWATKGEQPAQPAPLASLRTGLPPSGADCRARRRLLPPADDFKLFGWSWTEGGEDRSPSR